MQTTFQSASRQITASLGLAALTLMGLAAAPAAQAQTYTLNTLATFDGVNGQVPVGGLTLIGTTLYGDTLQGGLGFGSGNPGNGTVFSVPISGGAITSLASLGQSNLSNPSGGLTLIGSTLYGTTISGGTSNDGAVFSIPVAGGAPSVLSSFDASSGYSPEGNLVQVGGTLYGTQLGPATTTGRGSVFSVPLGGGTPTNLATFNGANGAYPFGGLTLVGNTFYGTTYQGGDNNDGAVFSVPVGGTTPILLASFSNNTNGGGPRGSLTLSADGKTLYGTTSGLNNSMGGDGTVFSIPVGGGPLTVLASFNKTNGYEPLSNLTLSADGSTLYGTTYGSANSVPDSFFGGGTVFSVSTKGGAVNDLYTFSGTDGSNPSGSLTLIGDTLYGTTTTGGANGDGTVFSLTPAAVPEASSLVSFSLLLLGGLAGMALRARQRRAVGEVHSRCSIPPAEPSRMPKPSV